jgi:hypothetical protein
MSHHNELVPGIFNFSKLSTNQDEKKEKLDKEALMLMSLSQQNLRALDDSKSDKFKKGMRILYEDEYDLLHKI